MPWCPKCKTEYVDSIKKCSDCGSVLVDDIEKPEEEDIVLNFNSQDHEEYLVTVSGDIRASLLEGLLNSEGIPVLKKYPGSSGYINIYMGISKLDVELYVPSRLLEKAKEIVSNFK